MRFRIRFAEQIVGLFIIVALASIALVIVLLGSSHRWFVRDASFYTELASAAGISRNMPVLYRGFTIGNVKEFSLNDDDFVEVTFSIFSEYRDRVRHGSIMELVASPIGLGNQFLFHPGKGNELVPEGGFLPEIDSPMGRSFIRQGLTDEPQRDNIAQILLGASNIVTMLETALWNATDDTTLGEIIGSLNRTIAGAEALPGTVNKSVENLVAEVGVILKSLNDILASVNPIINDLNNFSSMLTAPEGTVASILDSEADFYLSLLDSIKSISGILDSLDETVAFIPRQLPQLAALIMDIQTAMESANDLLISLANNPLLRGGIPERMDAQSTGTSPRDIRF